MTDSHIVRNGRHQVAHEFQPNLRHTRTPLLAYELSVDSGQRTACPKKHTAQPTTASPACFMIAVALLVQGNDKGNEARPQLLATASSKKVACWCIVVSRTVLRLATKAMYEVECTRAQGVAISIMLYLEV